MFNKNIKQKKLFFVFFLVIFMISPIVDTSIIQAAFPGQVIGDPSKPGDVVYSTGNPVQNLKIQTIYTGTNPAGDKDICVARLTWDTPAAGMPANAEYYRSYLTGGDKKDFYDDKKFDLTKRTTDVNGLTCGIGYNFNLIIAKKTGSLDQSLGDAKIFFTLAKPAASNPNNYLISWKNLTTTKAGEKCTATLSWNGPTGNLDDTRVTYRAIVAPNDGQGITQQYTSGNLPNTVFTQTTTGLPCGKSYTAEVLILVDGAKQRSIQKGFQMPAATAADGTTTPDPAATDPINIDEGDTTGTTTDIDDPADTGKSQGCTETCNANKWGWLRPSDEIRDMICNIQCTIIDWMGSMIQAMIENLLVNSIL